MQLESEQKDQLYTALAQAQVEFPTIRVNRKAFKNEYADLYAILKPIYPVLNKYGLSIRPWGGIINNEQWIGARIMHKSGQFETNVFKFEQDAVKNPNDQYTHKKQGALTYFNRNHIKDMLGVLISDDPEDDDGQSHLISNPTISEKEYLYLKDILKGYPQIEKDIEVYGNRIYSHFTSLKDIHTSDYFDILKTVEIKKRQYDNLNPKDESKIKI